MRPASRLPSSAATVALVVATTLAAAGPTHARGVGPDPLGPAYEALDALDYEEALERLEAVLARADLSAEDRNRAIEMEAACRVYLGDRDAALAGFAALHRRDPGWRLSDDYPPRVRAVYEEAFRQPREPIRVEIRPLPGPALRQGVLTIQIDAGADAVDRIWLVVPRPDGEEVRRLFVAAGPSFEARLPEDLVREGRPLDYAIEAHAPSGHVLARRNDRWTADLPAVEPDPRAFPPTFPPPPPPPPPADDDGDVETAWYESWWFWTIVGAAALGGAATGIYFGVAETGDGPRDGTGGNWVVW